MFFIVSKIGEFFITPVHVALFLAALGVGLLFTRCKRAGRALAAVGTAALLIGSFTPLGALLIAPLENRFPSPPENAPAPDGVIVLGGSVDEYITRARKQPTLNDAAERLTALVELARRYPQARLVFTGGTAALRGSPLSEAAAAERFFDAMGIEPGRVVYERRSRNTWENAVFTRELVAPSPSQRWLLVTSAAHMPRSIGIFRRIGFPVTAFPVDYRTGADPAAEWMRHKNAPEMLRLVDLAAHEWIGLVVYRLTGKTDALFPAP
jgi:uncharacterized SAM-binding protein YcdF (DUF218 family)